MEKTLKRRGNLVACVLIFIAVSARIVFAGDVVVQEGTLTTDSDSTVGGNLGVSGSGSFGNGIKLTSENSSANVIEVTQPNKNLYIKVNHGGTIRTPLTFIAGYYGIPMFDYYAPPLSPGGMFFGAYPSDTSLLSAASHGGSSYPLYIGNGHIQVELPSDGKCKTNIEDTRFSINDLMKIEVKDYQYKPEYMDDIETVYTGLIANDLQSIYPNAVGTGKRLVKKAVVEYDDDGNAEVIEPEVTEDYLYVSHKELVPLLIKSVQDLKLQKEQQDKEIQMLKDQLQTLKDELSLK